MRRTTMTTWTVLLVFCLAAVTFGAQRKTKRPASNGAANGSSSAADAEETGLPKDKRLLAIYKEFIVETLKVASEYERAKDIDSARTCYEQILKLVPNHPATKAALEKIAEKELSAGEKHLDVKANEEWQDAGITVIEGKPISIHAEGVWTFKLSAQLGPKGMEIPEDLKEFNLGSLVGIVIKEGSDPKEAKPFEIGEEATFTAEQSGRLYLRMYDSDPSDNIGRIKVTIKGTFEKAKKSASSE